MRWGTRGLEHMREGVTNEYEILFLQSKRPLGSSTQRLEYIIKPSVRDENCDDSADKNSGQIEFL
jgi:hypothetical protein